jgi:1-deoxy-D-xylulose-5-phosphate synthase
MAAADEVELTHMVHTMALHDSGPSAVATRAESGAAWRFLRSPSDWKLARAVSSAKARPSPSSSLGTRLEEAEKAAAMLEAKGLSTTVADMRFAKPLDEELIRRLLSTHEVAVTIEEGSAAVLERMF